MSTACQCGKPARWNEQIGPRKYAQVCDDCVTDRDFVEPIADVRGYRTTVPYTGRRFTAEPIAHQSFYGSL